MKIKVERSEADMRMETGYLQNSGGDDMSGHKVETRKECGRRGQVLCLLCSLDSINSFRTQQIKTCAFKIACIPDDTSHLPSWNKLSDGSQLRP